MNGQELGDSLNKAKALRDGGRCSLVRGSIAMECHGRRHSKSFKIQKRLFFDAFPAEPSQKVEFAVFSRIQGERQSNCRRASSSGKRHRHVSTALTRHCVEICLLTLIAWRPL